MNSMDHLDELLTCRLDLGRRVVEPCTIVIFGASGDLTSRKLIPALYHLYREKQLPDPFQIVGFARREKTDEAWREELLEALQHFSRIQPVDPELWTSFADRISYCRGDITEPDAYRRLKKHIESRGSEEVTKRMLFYLATTPSQFAPAAEYLRQSGLLPSENPTGAWQRLVVEKPFGYDLAGAQRLNETLTRYAHERQIFRIDHYLGKETVQNILMFRFSNAIFEQLWSRQSIDHVQITVSEKLGVGGRAGYYEESGALRDMVQNHLLQVMALIAMEPPVNLEPEAIRDEKVKLLRSIRIPSPAQVPHWVVRGQYSAGEIDGKPRPAYREEERVAPDSNVETYVALRLSIDNWRWSGVPFYLRTGKNLALSASEVRVQFRPTPHVLFAAQCGPRLDANSLTLRLQPDEGIALRFNGKIPGNSMEIRPVRMQFAYNAEFGAYTPEAYERLLLEAISGDATLFIRRDEVETAWKVVDPLRQAFAEQPLTEEAFYPAGSWGPLAAEALLAKEGRAWRNPQPSS